MQLGTVRHTEIVDHIPPEQPDVSCNAHVKVIECTPGCFEQLCLQLNVSLAHVSHLEVDQLESCGRVF